MCGKSAFWQWLWPTKRNVMLDVITFHGKLDGRIVRNAHNTVFGSKRSAICAQADYFLHLTRPSLTWLNSCWWLAACDWVMSVLSAVLSNRVGRRRKVGEFACTERTCQGNDFELIPTVEMETRNHLEGYFGSQFLAICNHCGVISTWSRKTSKKRNFVRFLKNDTLRNVSKILFRKFSSVQRSMCCVQISWNLADGKSVKSCVAYMTKTIKILPGSPAVATVRGSRPKYARAV